PVTFTADASKATLTVTVTGSRQPTETDTSHTAATADGADLLTLHFKAVDGNGNPVTSTPVHYTTAVTDAGIGQNTLACMTNGAGECTSTVKTTKAGTYNVWVALVPAGAAQPVSPVKTALVFLAGDPVPSGTSVAKTPAAPYAYSGSEIALSVNAKDAHGNVVPGWLLKNEVHVTTSYSKVTVSKPANTQGDTVTVTLTNTADNADLISKELRTNKATVNVGSAVTINQDASYVPWMNFCLNELGDNSTVMAPDGHGNATVGISKWQLCYFRGNSTGPDTSTGYVVPSNIVQQFHANVHGTTLVGGVPGDILTVNKLTAASSLVSGVTATITDQETGRIIMNEDSVFAERTHGTVYEPTLRGPHTLSYFAGFKQFASTDRSINNMVAAGRETCDAIASLVGTTVPYNQDWGHTPAQVSVANNLRGTDTIIGITSDYSVYGGMHKAYAYNKPPSSRGNGYYVASQYTFGNAVPVFGIWSSGTTATKETITNTSGAGLTQNVEGAYCSLP
ncbi:Ig-like domain-containing protein, partial [Salmonella enterica]|nr:Ig-like domain-containing protein [Salmonella enterica]